MKSNIEYENRTNCRVICFVLLMYSNMVTHYRLHVSHIRFMIFDDLVGISTTCISQVEGK